MLHRLRANVLGAEPARGPLNRQRQEDGEDRRRDRTERVAPAVFEVLQPVECLADGRVVGVGQNDANGRRPQEDSRQDIGLRRLPRLLERARAGRDVRTMLVAVRQEAPSHEIRIGEVTTKAAAPKGGGRLEAWGLGLEEKKLGAMASAFAEASADRPGS